MKNFKMISILTISLFISINCQKPPEAPKAEVKENSSSSTVTGTPQNLDLQKSVVKWIGTKVTGKHNGTIKISEGSILLDSNKIVGGKFTLDMNSITVEDLQGKDKMKLEGHLRTGDFFESDKFPNSTFEIVNVSENADGTASITGNLTMKGITKSITFPAKIAYDESKKPISATANFNIDRQLWGVTFKGQADNIISDDVNLDLNLVSM